jgi:hypothetical protein
MEITKIISTQKIGEAETTTTVELVGKVDLDLLESINNIIINRETTEELEGD